jgi:transcriptional regulator with XRE-family HTH domain
MDGKKLAQYVQAVMDAKGLTKTDIEKRSEKMVTDSHVAYVLAGKAKNPTLKILLGLAKGLDVDPVEVFIAAAGLLGADGLTTYRLAEMIDRIVRDEELARLFLILSHQKPAKIKALRKQIEGRENSPLH